MSQEDQSPQPAEPTDKVAEGEPVLAPPVPPAPPPPAPQPPPDFARALRPRPILGPALWVFGVLLWSFLVFGQYTTSWLPGSAPLAEGAAILFVLVATGAALIRAVRRSFGVPPLQQVVITRAINVGVSALAFWLGTVFIAFIIGRASGTNLDVLITSVLLVVSCVTVIQGRRMTSAMMPERVRGTPRERMVATLLWAGAVVMTLGACGELVGSN